MVSAKRLAQLANKWQRMAAMGRKRITQNAMAKRAAEECRPMTPVAVKGHCTVYTADGSRFEVPLAFLSTTVFSELLRMSQEEFGFSGSNDGRITLPCDAVVMEYAMRLLRRDASAEVVMAFLSSIARPCCFDGSVAAPCIGLSHERLCSTPSAHTPPTKHCSIHTSLLWFPAEKQEPETTMVSAKRLAQFAKKWQRMAAFKRKRLTTAKEDEMCCISVAVKGHCVMYTANGMRFEVALVYLSTTIFSELLRMSQEALGFASDGKITLPCDGVCHVLAQEKCHFEVENALLSSMVTSCHYTGCTILTVGANWLFVAPEEHACRACSCPLFSVVYLDSVDR
uniref:Auxin-induced protein 6B n=2 Tax=Aegilops tauschii TaxID=37682 RepID=M8CCE6_AEGTA